MPERNADVAETVVTMPAEIEQIPTRRASLFRRLFRNSEPGDDGERPQMTEYRADEWLAARPDHEEHEEQVL